MQRTQKMSLKYLIFNNNPTNMATTILLTLPNCVYISSYKQLCNEVLYCTLYSSVTFNCLLQWLSAHLQKLRGGLEQESEATFSS